MNSPRKSFNPFYVGVVIAGVAFTVTACAYGVMTVRDLRATEPVAADAPGEPLMQWLRDHGFTALMIELGVLTVMSVGAMATDSYWTRRDSPPHSQGEP